MNIKVKKTHEDAIIPSYQSDGSSGFDFHSIENIKICKKKYSLVKTGLSFAIEKGYELQVRPRSGLALKNGITVLNSPGTVDSDYRGEVGVVLINHGDDDFIIKKGDRIAQGVICPISFVSFQEVQNLDDTSRGEKGFGSTGI